MSSKRNRRRVRRVRGHWLGEFGDEDAPRGKRIGSDHYLLAPPTAPKVQCPDCGASWSAGRGGSLDHADGCPIASGYAAAADDDAAWFDAHPEATVRRRPPTWPEVQTVLLMSGRTLPDMPNGVSYAPGGEVVVTQLAPGARRRDFRGAMMLAQVGPS